MNLKDKDIDKIKDTFNFLYSWSEWHDDAKEEFETQIVELKDENIDKKNIKMYFPDDY